MPQDLFCFLCIPLDATILMATTLAFLWLAKRRRTLGFLLGFALGLVLGPLMIELTLIKNDADLYGLYLGLV
jgi:hypothetical protein